MLKIRKWVGFISVYKSFFQTNLDGPILIQIGVKNFLNVTSNYYM